MWLRIRLLTTLVLVLLLPQNSDSFVPSRRRGESVCRECGEPRSRNFRYARPHVDAPAMTKPKDDGDDDGMTSRGENLNDEVDAFIVEQEANRRINDRLLLPQKVATSISKTVNTLALSFIIFGFILNVFGYAYVRDENGLRIDTMDAKRFQDEIVRSMRSDKK